MFSFNPDGPKWLKQTVGCAFYVLVFSYCDARIITVIEFYSCADAVLRVICHFEKIHRID